MPSKKTPKKAPQVKRAGPQRLKPIRYAVVGLGHIAQVAVLPGFKHAPNSELAALVSGDPEKLRLVGRKHKVKGLYTYEEYPALLASGSIDAVYLCLPNHLHRAHTLQAAEAGIHVLCEKPLGVSEGECRAMIRACDENRVRLMTAYRLHFDPATLKAVAEIRKGSVGEPRFMHAVLSHVVSDPRNIRRLPRPEGGGPLYDLGIYCINAARSLFQAEPIEVTALMHATEQDREAGVETSVSGVLRFPRGQLASFECSNNAHGMSELSVTGSKGVLRLENAFEYTEARTLHLETKQRKRSLRVPRQDQFGAELLYFSDCIQRQRQPQPSGWEGLADVRVIRALHQSALTLQSVALEALETGTHPQPGQEIELPPVEKTEVVKAAAPSAS